MAKTYERLLSKNILGEKGRDSFDPQRVNLLGEDSICMANLLVCLLYTSPSPRDQRGSRMPSSA